MPKTGRFPWGDVPLACSDEVIPNAALFRTAGPGMFVAGSRRRRTPLAKRRHVPGDDRRRGSTCGSRITCRPSPSSSRSGLTTGTAQLEDAAAGTVSRDHSRSVPRFNIPVVAHTVKLADAKELCRAGPRRRHSSFQFEAAMSRTPNF